MQPSESITGGSGDYFDLTLLDLSVDYQLQRPWLLAALGVTEADLRQWEAAFTTPPTIETVALPDDEQDFDVQPRGETEFILDDPDEEDEEDEDAEGEESEDDDSEDDEDEDEDDDEDEDADVEDEDEDDDGFEGVDDEDFDPDDVTVDEDDGEV